jgi:hypothetical protein
MGKLLAAIPDDCVELYGAAPRSNVWQRQGLVNVGAQLDSTLPAPELPIPLAAYHVAYFNTPLVRQVARDLSEMIQSKAL